MKQEIIRILQDFVDSKMGNDTYYLAGIKDSISLVKQMEDEPITEETLVASDWRKKTLEFQETYCYRKTDERGNTIDVYIINGKAEVYLIGEDHESNHMRATKMSHLTALEEMFLQ